MTRITIDDFILLDTINFIHEKGKFTTMEIEDDIEGNMNFEIRFSEDEKDKSTRLVCTPTDKFNAIITAYNYKGWQTTKDLMLLGTYKKIYSLYMRLSARTMMVGVREVTISLFIKTKINGCS